MKFKPQDKYGTLKSICIAYFILFIHVFLLAGIGLLVILFQGVYQYLPWILSGIAICVLGMAIVFYKKMRKSSANIRDILAFPEFRDRTIEIKLLGGMASFTLKAKEENHMLIDQTAALEYKDRQLPAQTISETERKIIQLATLYEHKLLTKDEFKKKKQDIING
ncbi:MAG: SHOCT domain-containing protein [Desulfobacteraceae bacterium]|nr:SHOCT domain-containing protein [Desulfobacteraceae bacterium]